MVYNYFPSKAELLLALTEQFWRGVSPRPGRVCSRGRFLAFFREVYARLGALAAVYGPAGRSAGPAGRGKRGQGRAGERQSLAHMQAGFEAALAADKNIRPGAFSGRSAGRPSRPSRCNPPWASCGQASRTLPFWKKPSGAFCIKRRANFMQAIMETLFDIVYLCTVITMGILMIRRAKGHKPPLLFGIMAVTLGCGDAFHLIPRAFALCTDGLANHAAALGAGKLITSITMTVFTFCCTMCGSCATTKKLRPHRGGLPVGGSAGGPVPVPAERLAQRRSAPLSWGIWRNLPFAAMGVVIIVLFFREARAANDRPFRFMWLAITLSFAFLHPGGALGRRSAPGGHAHDPKNLRLCVGGVHGLAGRQEISAFAARTPQGASNAPACAAVFSKARRTGSRAPYSVLGE